MAWDTTMTAMLRQVVGDAISPYTYTDSQMKALLVTNAQLIRTEMTFDNTYTIDIPNSGISPDPTATSPVDDLYMNFVVLKSAAILVGAEARVQAKIGISIKDGPASIDVGGSANSVAARAKDMLNAYVRAKINYIAGNSIGAKSVLSPYTSAAWGYSSPEAYFN